MLDNLNKRIVILGRAIRSLSKDFENKNPEGNVTLSTFCESKSLEGNVTLSGVEGLKYLLLLFALLPLSLLAQVKEDEKNAIIEKRVEYLIDDAEESDADYTTLFDQLSFYYDHPLNLNRADLNDLEQLGLLTSIQINNLLTHIERNGKLMTLEELQTIDGFDLEMIRMLLPFVKLTTDVDNAQLTLKELLKNGENELYLRYQQVLEEQVGYSPATDSALAASPNSRYKGDAAKLYTRYRFKYGNHLSIGFTAEKDPGEEFFSGGQSNGFDFYSAHIFLRNQGKIKQLALGDFQAQFGQGLTYWSGAAFGKSADIMNVKRSAVGLKPYTSVDESRFLRGGGLTLGFGNVEITSFYSYNNIDGNISVADSSSQDYDALAITSIQQTGLHRTENELEDKDAVTQQQFGGHVAYKTRRLNVGLTGIHSQIDAQFTPNLQTYSQFRNADQQQTNVGLDYNWIYRNFNFFGEYAQSVDAGSGFVSGALITLDPRVSMVALYRDYDRDFHPISSAGIGEASTNENEKGTLLGVVAKPVKKFTVSAYYDQFVFPWLKYQIDAPSRGYQYLAQLTYTPSKKLEMYVRVRERDKLENTSTDLSEGLDYLVHEKQINYRFQYNYKVSESVRLKGRAELVNYDKEESPFETGFLIYQDVVYQPLSSPFSFSFRYGIFDTDSYNSRIYAYENDILYVFSIPAYYNRGTRTYLMCRYKIKRGIDLWVRYGATFYDNIDVISSGLEEIQGSTKSEIKAQLRIKF
ncbi:MAG: hypothetical protein KDD41_04090 [Flavobacteriales bacterium]|nr:hypothetical protein [Flavobacteriales bacterium]